MSGASGCAWILAEKQSSTGTGPAYQILMLNTDVLQSVLEMIQKVLIAMLGRVVRVSLTNG